MRIPTLGSRRTVTAAATLSLAAASIAGIAMAPSASAASVPLTLSTSSGPSAGGNSLTATSTANTFLSGTAFEFQVKTTTSTICSTTYATPSATAVAVVSPHLLSQKKAVVTVPAGVVLTAAGGTPTTLNWLLCSYSGAVATTSPVTGTAAYAIAAAPTLVSVSSASGPALGGGTITITGTNFSATTTAMIGTAPLTSVTYVDSAHITGVVPSQAASSTALPISVTTAGGTVSGLGYTYSNGIIISPNTAPTATAATDIDVQGVGFSSLNFATTTGTLPDDATASVYITAGQYLLSGSAKTLGETGECLNVLVIDDGELICTINTADSDGVGSGSAAIANGLYSIAVVGNGAANAATTTPVSILSSGSAFVVAPY
jgi:hypothetical protein